MKKNRAQNSIINWYFIRTTNDKLPAFNDLLYICYFLYYTAYINSWAYALYRAECLAISRSNFRFIPVSRDKD